MKKLFLTMVALVVATMSYAQNSLLATLSHDGDITTFYGASALKQAHEAAEHGDVITLSSGTFTSTDITKAITLRGAGWKFDVANHKEPTILSGDFTINIPETVDQRLTIEGIYHNSMIYYKKINNAKFVKNRFKTINYYNSESRFNNVEFIQCIIFSYFFVNGLCSATCINCFVSGPKHIDTTTSNCEYINCILAKDEDFSVIRSSQLTNCILVTEGVIYPLPSSVSAFNCLCVAMNSIYNCFSNIPNSTNKTVLFSETPFENCDDYNMMGLDDETFELTDEAKAKYLGTDGTEIGMYGGMLPFSSTTTNPQITKCNVAAKSTADGKLSVDIEVSSAE